jgi:hypothetical protein
MGFRIKPARSGAGQRSTKLSIAAAPYQVNFKNGKRRMCGQLREIYQDISMESVASVFDRHERSFLDLECLWKRHRRKFVPGHELA